MRVTPWITWIALTMPVVAQATRQPLEARVTSVTNGTAYLDRGRSDGIEIGDVVVLYPPGQAPIRTTISAVSRTSSRADLPDGTTVATTGFRAEVAIERSAPVVPSPASAEPEETPQHPPWANTETGFDQARPLLAPAFGQGPAARPTEIHGRVFTNYSGTWDDGFGGRQYSLARVGTDFTVENPVGLGGKLRFRGVLTGRFADLDDVPDTSSERGRLDRLSYAWGDDEKAPIRVEAGRFLPKQTPELGVIDGVEALLPVGGSGTLGASLGGLLEPFPSQASGDDVQTALSYRHVTDEETPWFDGRIALQKTWHKGAPDRDLVFLDATVRPSEDLFFHSSAWIDYYTASDVAKSRGLELTELHAQSTYRIHQDHGVGVAFSHIRWPDLKRSEFRALPPDLLRDTRLDRFSLNTSHQLSESVRLDLRVDHYDDQNGNGTNGEARVALRDVLYDQGEVSAAVFHQDGSFTSGSGLRLRANRYLGFGYGTLRYEIATYDNVDLGGDEDLLLHAAGADLSFDVGRSTSATINVDYRFGDAQEYLTLGAFVQTRF